MPIYNLGDGIQNLIIVTYNMFANKDRCLFFIEEPDLSMHPGLQRAFLEILTRFDQHQYFLTTHSNHLLDMSADFENVSVYLFRKEGDQDEVTYEVGVATSPNANILRELGVRNSSVFLTNATIWVEGITDRMYMRELLKKLQDEKAAAQDGNKATAFQEDIHFSFVEYQGSNLVHWTFDDNAAVDKIKANRLCARSFLVADGDVSEKGTRADDYRKMLGDRFHILPCKEIENALPEEIVRELAKEKFLEHGKDVALISHADYSALDKGIGDYLDDLLGTDKPVFAAPSGTLRNKVSFSEQAVSLMNKADFKWSLTPVLRDLCEKIYGFVASENC